MKLRVLDLFSGIGGFSLGLERAKLEGAEIDGFETVAFCEIEEFPRKVLAKHWPNVPCYRDVRELTAERLAADGIAVDVITGGFPCQDVSTAGTRSGIGDGTRSGLYSEVIRLARDIRPKFIILENVAGLLSGPSEQPGGWFSRVLGDLASGGFDAEWENIPASIMGASHRRERVWIIAYPIRIGLEAFTHEARICDKAFALWNARRFGEVGGSREWAGIRPTGAIPVELVNGVSGRLGEIKGYGNAVVPQIPELIGNAILETINFPRNSLAREGRGRSTPPATSIHITADGRPIDPFHEAEYAHSQQECLAAVRSPAPKVLPCGGRPNHPRTESA